MKRRSESGFCCGGKRAALRYETISARRSISAMPKGRGILPPDAIFEYVGLTTLTVKGPVSGRTYRFDKPGTQITVDGRDAYGLSTIPVVKLIKD